MKISRLDLDGAGSPHALVTRILQLAPGLMPPIPIEQLCAQFDIQSIQEIHTDGFEAALVTDELKSAGAILVAAGRDRRRRRFSIAHELGHFLIPAHRPEAGSALQCWTDHFRMFTADEQRRRSRIESEANRFAALLLIPPPLLRAQLASIRRPAIGDIIRLSDHFEVSKDAMARAYADYTRAAVAFVVISNGKVLRSYRKSGNFPFIAVSSGQPVPGDSLYHSVPKTPGVQSGEEECEPSCWLSERDDHHVEFLTEQVLIQREGFALLMLQAELRDEDEMDDRGSRAGW